MPYAFLWNQNVTRKHFCQNRYQFIEKLHTNMGSCDSGAHKLKGSLDVRGICVIVGVLYVLERNCYVISLLTELHWAKVLK